MYYEGKPRPELAAQRLFFAIAHSYCKANNLDLTPEAETGAGPVDFKVSSGFEGRVLVEIKLSKNPILVDGYTKQLAAYKTSEETISGMYIVIDVGSMGKKGEKLIDIKNNAQSDGKRCLQFILLMDQGANQLASSKQCDPFLKEYFE